MVITILGFCKAKDSSVLIDNISDESVKVHVDDKTAEKVELLFVKAGDYCNDGKFEGAKNSIYKLIKLWPFHSEAYRLLAQIQSERGELDKAIDTDLEALRFDEKNLWALILMGNLFAAKGKHDVSETYYRKVMEYYPNNALALNNLGGIFCKRQEYARGVEFFKKALEIDAGCISAYYGLALACEKQGKSQEAFDTAMQGMKLGVERPENVTLRPQLFQVAVDAANLLADEVDLMPDVMQVARGIEHKYSTTVKFVEDNSLKVLAHMEFADHHERTYHVVKYRRGNNFAHLALHELMHLEMMLEAKAAGRLEVISFAQENFDLFMERNAKVFDSAREELGNSVVDGLAKQLFDGLSVQMMSVPLDLFVESKIYNDYPKFRAAQLASLWNMEVNNFRSVESAADVAYFPQELKDINKLLNMVQATFFEKHYGLDNVARYAAPMAMREKARNMYSRFEAVFASYKPGDEYALFEEFARQENIFEYFCIKGQGETPDDVGIKTQTERNQEAFNKAHATGDPMVDAMMSEYMLDAMRLFDAMTPSEIENVARECAFKGLSGIKTAAGAKYTLKCFPNKQFSGYELLAYYYVSWAQAFPEMLLETGLPFHHAYEMAKRMREKER